jgi:hypothetical protein
MTKGTLVLVLAATVAAFAIAYIYQRIRRLAPATLEGVEVATRCSGRLIAALADALTLAADLARTLARQTFDVGPAGPSGHEPTVDDDGLEDDEFDGL